MGEFTAFPIQTAKPSEIPSAPLPLTGTEIVLIPTATGWLQTTVADIAAQAIGLQTEFIQDTIAAFLVAGSGVTLTYNDPANTLTISASGSAPPVSVTFTANGDAYFVSDRAYTLAVAREAGTGTLAYATALAANPTSFSSASLTITLAVGDVLRITCSGIGAYKAVTLSAA
jgi:hypothetical protein